MAGTLRMRIFAGPNGSGKSMMYREVRHAQVNDRPVDLGVYINPDDIAKQLREHLHYDFSTLGLVVNEVKFGRYARRSGLLTDEFPWTTFQTDQQWSLGVLRL